MTRYPDRHLDPSAAEAYRLKFEKTFLRRLGSRRERSLVERAVRRALALLPPQEREGARLLDLPCGAGRFAPLLASLAGAYHAADHSPHMLDLCRQALERAGLLDRVSGFSRGDARDLPLEDGSFDLACCLRLIHHFPEEGDRARIFRELRRVDPGPLVLTFLDAESPKQWIHERRSALSRLPNRRATLSRERLGEEALRAGFELIRTWSLSGMFSGQTVALLR